MTSPNSLPRNEFQSWKDWASLAKKKQNTQSKSAQGLIEGPSIKPLPHELGPNRRSSCSSCRRYL